MANQEQAQILASTSVEKAKRFWENLSQYYIKTNKLHDLRTRSIVEALISEANVQQGDHILDAGCGHLRISLGILKLIPQVQITGMDLTEDLLKEGQKICEEHQLTSIRLVCGDIGDLPFHDQSFDSIVSARVFQYISDPVKTIQELKRVLKPGGRLAISTPNRLNFIKRWTYKGRLHSPQEIRQWLKEAGFTHIRANSACFLPGWFNRGWNSTWFVVEKIRNLFPFKFFGGNAIASGQKPLD